MIKIKTLENVTFSQITDSFNDSFSDYFFPVKFTKEQFRDKFSSEGGRLDLSIGVFDGDNLVAFILNFIENVNGETINYNGGTGVIPKFRGNRLTTKMYDFMLPILKDNNVDKMILEVLVQNSSALRIYKDRGFRIMREVNCFRGKINETTQNILGAKFEIKEFNNLDWGKLQSFWDYPPTWQNSKTTMNNIQNQNLQIGIMENDVIRGYLIYNPKLKRIHQMAIDKEYRNIGLGSHLLNYIYKMEKQDISLINVDSRMNNFKHFLEKRGLKNNFNQYEMERYLS